MFADSGLTLFLSEIIKTWHITIIILQYFQRWSDTPVFRVHVDGEWLHLVHQEHMHHLPAEYHCHLLEEPLKVPHSLGINLKQASQQGCHQLPQASARYE